MPWSILCASIAGLSLLACGPSAERADRSGVSAAAGTGLKVQYHTYSGATGNQLSPLIRIVNAGATPVALSQLTVRYWYTKDGAQAQSYWCDYTPRGCANVRARFVAMQAPVASADTYLELSFTPGAGSLAPGASTGDVQSRIAKSDWSSYDQANDWSYGGTRSSVADWDRVTLYDGGELIWGVEPGGPAPTDTQAPTAPANLVSTGSTTSAVSLAWSPSTDDVGVTGYDVYSGATRVTTSTATAATVSGLAPSTTYTFTVRARDAAGNTSTPSEAVTATTGSASRFELLWQDDFDSFDGARWQLMTHSWDGNLATFSTANTRFQDGILSLLLTREPSDTVKPFRGVEMRSRETLTYGKIETRARYARGSGVVSGTVLIYTPWPPDSWNELDIEYLGAFADRMQFNAMVWMGGQPVTPTQFPQTVSLGFDAAADFHVYAIEWTPTIVRFTVDGAVRATWSSEIARMTLPQNILLTIWASNASGWAGPILSSSAPTQADFDWIRVYRYRP